MTYLPWGTHPRNQQNTLFTTFWRTFRTQNNVFPSPQRGPAPCRRLPPGGTIFLVFSRIFVIFSRIFSYLAPLDSLGEPKSPRGGKNLVFFQYFRISSRIFVAFFVFSRISDVFSRISRIFSYFFIFFVLFSRIFSYLAHLDPPGDLKYRVFLICSHMFS